MVIPPLPEETTIPSASVNAAPELMSTAPAPRAVTAASTSIEPFELTVMLAPLAAVTAVPSALRSARSRAPPSLVMLNAPPAVPSKSPPAVVMVRVAAAPESKRMLVALMSSGPPPSTMLVAPSRRRSPSIVVVFGMVSVAPDMRAALSPASAISTFKTLRFPTASMKAVPAEPTPASTDARAGEAESWIAITVPAAPASPLVTSSSLAVVLMGTKPASVKMFVTAPISPAAVSVTRAEPVDATMFVRPPSAVPISPLAESTFTALVVAFVVVISPRVISP